MMTIALEKTNTDVIIRIPKEYWDKTDMINSSEVKVDTANCGIEIVDSSVKTWDIDKFFEEVTPKKYLPSMFPV